MVISPSGKPIHAGHKNYTIAPGTARGDNYCARSSGIKSKGKWSANALARKMWGCSGKKSYRRLAGKIGGRY
tara:strand:+ start:771 stop:986 length:216 start_codon:yes stop_codon:yes gene_type:complete